MQQTKKTEENKITTRQKIKKEKAKRCCRRQPTWLIIALLLHRYRSTVKPISLYCRPVVAPLPHRYCTAIVPLSLCCCCSVVALLSHRYRTAIAPLSLRCCRSYCRYAVAPISHRYRATVALLLLLLLLIRSRTAIAPLSLHCRCCHFCCCNGITSAIAPSVTHGCRLKRQNKGNSFHW